MILFLWLYLSSLSFADANTSVVIQENIENSKDTLDTDKKVHADAKEIELNTAKAEAIEQDAKEEDIEEIQENKTLEQKDNDIENNADIDKKEAEIQKKPIKSIVIGGSINQKTEKANAEYVRGVISYLNYLIDEKKSPVPKGVFYESGGKIQKDNSNVKNLVSYERANVLMGINSMEPVNKLDKDLAVPVIPYASFIENELEEYKNVLFSLRPSVEEDLSVLVDFLQDKDKIAVVYESSLEPQFKYITDKLKGINTKIEKAKEKVDLENNVVIDKDGNQTIMKEEVKEKKIEEQKDNVVMKNKDTNVNKIDAKVEKMETKGEDKKAKEIVVAKKEINKEKDIKGFIYKKEPFELNSALLNLKRYNPEYIIVLGETKEVISLFIRIGFLDDLKTKQFLIPFYVSNSEVKEQVKEIGLKVLSNVVFPTLKDDVEIVSDYTRNSKKYYPKQSLGESGLEGYITAKKIYDSLQNIDLSQKDEVAKALEANFEKGTGKLLEY